MSPAEKAKALAILREYVPTIPAFRNAEIAKWLTKTLRQAEEICREPIDFELGADCRFLVNGQRVNHRGKGLAVAWFVLACIQYRQGPVTVASLFPGARGTASATQTLHRTADAVERVSPGLARAIRAIGVMRGELVLKHNPQVDVNCTSAALTRIYASRDLGVTD